MKFWFDWSNGFRFLKIIVRGRYFHKFYLYHVISNRPSSLYEHDSSRCHVYITRVNLGHTKNALVTLLTIAIYTTSCHEFVLHMI